MSRPKRPNFKPEFRLEVAQLVLDKGYSIREAAEAMDVGKSTVDKWARQLKEEKEISKKATALLLSDSMKILASFKIEREPLR
ncbi:MAG: transposase [Oleispira sp.]|jgi:transposase